ncbi:MAG: hypothetical protein H0U53_00115 [Actinobacteria bacterium]|nr:hypothetical protein [Actinomycetota bacterium]
MSEEGGAVRDSELNEIQVEILLRYAMGDSSRQVARCVKTSEATMRRILKEARESLGASNTVNAVYLAAKAALI